MSFETSIESIDKTAPDVLSQLRAWRKRVPPSVQGSVTKAIIELSGRDYTTEYDTPTYNEVDFDPLSEIRTGKTILDTVFRVANSYHWVQLCVEEAVMKLMDYRAP